MDIQDLYNKVESFHSNTSLQVTDNMACQKGCSQCCYVELSVFSIEAENIKTWFQQLSTQEREDLKIKLKSQQDQKLNFFGEITEPCCFLKEDKCLIYDVRPLICRTQGNALMISSPNDSTYIDICPLNEGALSFLQKKDVINLDILNSILVQMNHHFGYNENRISLRSLITEL